MLDLYQYNVVYFLKFTVTLEAFAGFCFVVVVLCCCCWRWFHNCNILCIIHWKHPWAISSWERSLWVAYFLVLYWVFITDFCFVLILIHWSKAFVNNIGCSFLFLRNGCVFFAIFRVVGTLQNSPDFAAAFGCKNGQYMNPDRKCYVW